MRVVCGCFSLLPSQKGRSVWTEVIAFPISLTPVIQYYSLALSHALSSLLQSYKFLIEKKSSFQATNRGDACLQTEPDGRHEVDHPKEPLESRPDTSIICTA